MNWTIIIKFKRYAHIWIRRNFFIHLRVHCYIHHHHHEMLSFKISCGNRSSKQEKWTQILQSDRSILQVLRSCFIGFSSISPEFNEIRMSPPVKTYLLINNNHFSQFMQFWIICNNTHNVYIAVTMRILPFLKSS